GVEEIAARYRARRKTFVEAISDLDGVCVRGAEGSMYVMLDISRVNPDCEAFAWDLLEAERIAVLPGTSFGNAPEVHVRISMCQDETVLKEAAARLRRFILRQQQERSAAE